MLLRGKIVDKNAVQQRWPGYRAVASYTRLVTADGTDSPVPVPAELSASASPDDGTFHVQLPDTKEIQDPVTIRILAPAGEILSSTDFTADALATDDTQSKTIDFPVVPKAAFEIVPSDDPFLGARAKLTGRVLDFYGNRLVANKQVIVFGQRPGAPADAPYDAVVITRTDTQGYFSVDYPRVLDEAGNPGAPVQLARAHAVVSGAKGVDGATDLPLTLTTLGSFDGVLPRNVILVVKLDDDLGVSDSSECECATAVPRVADNVDLTSSPASFSMDLGGGRCVKLTTPNRALEEFSFYTVVRTTDPEILGLPDVVEQPHVPWTILREIAAVTQDGGNALEAAVAPSPGNDVLMLMRSASPSRARTLASGGTELSPSNGNGGTTAVPIVDPALLSKRLRAGFNAQNLKVAASQSMQRAQLAKLDVLAYSAPGRAALTASNPVDWDSDEPRFYEATTIAHGHILHFKQVWRADGYSLGDLLYSLPLAPAQKKQIAIVDWERRETAARSESLSESESLSNLLTRDRDINEIVSVALREHLHGDSTSITGGGGQGSGGAGSGSYGGFNLGAVVGSAFGGGFSNATANQDAARDLSASFMQKIRDATFQAASAVRNQRSTVIQTVAQGETVSVTTEAIANHNHCHALTMEYFEVLRHFQVTQELADVQECLLVPLLMAPFDDRKALRWRDILTAYLRKPELAPGFDAIDRIQSNYADADVPTGTFAHEALLDLAGAMQIVVRVPTGASEGVLQQAWHAVTSFFAGTSAKNPTANTGIALKLETATGTVAVPVDFTIVSEFAPDVPLTVSFHLSGPLPSIKRSDIVAAHFLWDDKTVKSDFPDNSAMFIKSVAIRYRTPHLAHVLCQDASLNAGMASKEVYIPTPVDAEESRNPRKEDSRLERLLLAHLNEHIEYYHKAIWWSMDADRRFMLLDGFIAPNANGRSVASVVENRLIGFIGNSMVLPVGPGFHLDPTYKVDPEDPIDLINLYAPTTPVPPMRVSVPTRGVFAEAVMGNCNSCETIDETRFWRWDQAPSGEEPTPIQQPSTGTRATPDPNLQPQPFPQPIVQIQNAPAEPDPTGLANALKVIGTPNLFKDITGLDQTQKNSLAAMQASLDAAKFFGGEASKLAQQAGMKNGGIDKSLQSIQQAQKSGLIDKDQANELAVGALRSLVGNDADKRKLTQEPPIKDLIDSASKKGKSKVSLDTGTEKLEVEQDDTEPSTSLVAATITIDTIATIGGVDIQQVHGEDAFFYLAKLSVDADGAPHAYNDDNSKALDNLGNMWSPVIDPATGQKAKQPDGYYVSATSLGDPKKKDTDQSKYVDATAIPYVVVSGSTKLKGKWHVGDFSVAYNTQNDTIAYAIVADSGPADSVGEGSIRLAEVLDTYPAGAKHDARHGGVDPKAVIYVIFPNTRKSPAWPLTEAEVVAAAQKAFEDWGGTSKLKQLFPTINPPITV
jgi:hypothetical protein